VPEFALVVPDVPVKVGVVAPVLPVPDEDVVVLYVVLVSVAAIVILSAAAVKVTLAPAVSVLYFIAVIFALSLVKTPNVAAVPSAAFVIAVVFVFGGATQVASSRRYLVVPAVVDGVGTNPPAAVEPDFTNVEYVVLLSVEDIVKLPEVSAATLVAPEPVILWLLRTAPFSIWLRYTLPFVNAAVVLAVAVAELFTTVLEV
jgi:hypothetical protein